MTTAIWAPPPVLFMTSQTLNMPVVSVCTAKKSTVPKSFRVSISTSATPTTIDGRAMGNETRRNAAQAEHPSVRAASPTPDDCSRNADRASR
jgi:hypothetical protein